MSMGNGSEKGVFEAKITSRGQMVIPKPLREKYNLKEGVRVKVIATGEGILLKSGLEGPWTGLRGIMKDDWRGEDLDRLIAEAKKSLFKITER